MNSAERIIALAEEHPSQHSLIYLAALSILWLKPQDRDARQLLAAYREQNLSLDALRETALQLFLLAGFQASLEAAFQIREEYGAGLPPLETELAPPDPRALLDRGYRLQAEVYGENTAKLRANLSGISPELEAWTVLVGYGLVLSRPGLPPHWRELLEVAVLAVQGFTRQLHSHLRGALNLGGNSAEIETVLQVAEILGPAEPIRSAWQIWRLVRPKGLPE
jgi:4-carboxymuconolactone decarboxylase